MSEYFSTDQKTITSIGEGFNLDSNEVNEEYNSGYVLTRLGKGIMNQTRSLRIDLSKFELTSENRRILKKTEGLEAEFKNLPIDNYSWEIHKLGKDFYSRKFGDDTMSASKIKELFTDMEKSNMNSVFEYTLESSERVSVNVGYCLTYSNHEIIHYAYPFYNLDFDFPNLGLGMMLRAINWAKENGKQYIYLGSVTDSSAKYKLQFEGLEWFDTDRKEWSSDVNKLKELIS